MVRWAFGCAGLLAALVIIGISTAMNFQFGASWGTTAQAKVLMGVTFASFDILLAILPFAIYAAWVNRRWFALVCAVPFGALLITLSFMSAVGFTTTNRAETMGEVRLVAAELVDRETELRHLIERRDFIPEHRPIGVVAAALKAQENHPRWISSEGCRNATVRASIEWCAGHAELRQELAAADERATTDEEIRLVRTEIRRLRSTDQAGLEGRDPQLAALDLLVRVAHADGQSRENVKAPDADLLLPLLIAVAVVASNVFGLPLVLSFLGRPSVSAPAKQASPDLEVGSALADGTGVRIIPISAMARNDQSFHPLSSLTTGSAVAPSIS